MRWGWLALLVVSGACTDGGSSGAKGDNALAREMVGAWDATMRVSHPYPLQLRASDAVEICGTIGLVENHGKAAVVDEAGAVTHLGVYDLPLSRLGLEWSGVASFPAATIGTGVGTNTSRAADNSVRIVLNPGSEERIILSGRYEAKEIRGTWTAQSARGTATGSFSMQPHTSSRMQSGNC